MDIVKFGLFPCAGRRASMTPLRYESHYSGWNRDSAEIGQTVRFRTGTASLRSVKSLSPNKSLLAWKLNYLSLKKYF